MEVAESRCGMQRGALRHMWVDIMSWHDDGSGRCGKMKTSQVLQTLDGCLRADGDLSSAHYDVRRQ